MLHETCRKRHHTSARLSVTALHDECGTAACSLNHVGDKLRRSTAVTRRMNDTQSRCQIEGKGVKAKGQSLTDRFQGRFLQAPELKKGSSAYRAIGFFDGRGLKFRKIPVSEVCSLQVGRSILKVDTDPMCR